MVATTIFEVMVNLTDIATEKVKAFLESENAAASGAGLRVGVRGGGCSGFQYSLALDEQRDDDQVFEHEGIEGAVDPGELESTARRSTTPRA